MSNSIVLRGETQRAYAIRFLTELRIDPERPFEMTLAPYKKKRSLSQNALMWVRYGEVAKAVADYTGMAAEDIHEFAKQRWLTPKVFEVGDQIVQVYSSKNLTTAEMTAFLDQFEAWASGELGILLAQPEDRRAA